MNAISLRQLTSNDWTSVSRIYADGIATGLATFETEVPSWEVWDAKYIQSCRLVAVFENIVVGFAVLSQVSPRAVYKGVAEVSVYVDADFRGRHIGETLLNQLIIESEAGQYWTLQAGIFSLNTASIALHQKCGFRIIGFREKIGQFHGKWFDNHFLERRSRLVMNE